MARNVFSLYGIQFAQYGITLITLPYLARVLGAAGWGAVAFTQSLALYMMIVVEFGFNFSGTRSVAREQGNPHRQEILFAGTQGAKLLLAALCWALLLAAFPFLPIVGNDPRLFLSGLWWATAQGLSLFWFFQGIERLGKPAVLEIATKAISVPVILFLVNHPADAWRVVAIQAAAASFSLGGSLWLVSRYVRIRLPRVQWVKQSLVEGWSLFVFRSSLSMYAAGNTFILGFFAPVGIVGLYSAADKLVRFLSSLSDPITRAFFPRLSHLVHLDSPQAKPLARRLILWLVGWALGLSIMGSFASHIVLELVFGGDFVDAQPILRLLVWMLPLSAFSGVVGTQLLIPMGLERTYTRIVVMGGATNVALAFALTPSLQGLGMAMAAISSEAVVAAAALRVVQRHRLLPCTKRVGDR